MSAFSRLARMQSSLVPVRCRHLHPMLRAMYCHRATSGGDFTGQAPFNGPGPGSHGGMDSEFSNPSGRGSSSQTARKLSG